jgi:hypothetical protein
MLIFGGAGFVALGVCLFKSERKLRESRRRSNEHRRVQPFSAAQRSEPAAQAESTTAHAEVVEKTPSFAARLEAWQRTIEENQSEQRQLASARYENRELQSKIGNLTKQLHANEWRLSESARQIQQLGQHNTHLQNEVGELKRRKQELLAVIDSLTSTLAANERTIEELQAIRHGPPSENQELRAVKPELEQTIASLTDQLHPSESRLSRSACEETDAESWPENETEKPAAWSFGERQWRVGLVPAGAALAILGVIAIGFLGSADKFFGSKDPGAATPQRSAPSQFAATTKTEVSKPPSPAALESPVKGAFKIIQPTELFNGPSEESAFITTIHPGTKINVVGARLGWLEIRGLGRRSGFVRQESAVRIDPNKNS